MSEQRRDVHPLLAEVGDEFQHRLDELLAEYGHYRCGRCGNLDTVAMAPGPDQPRQCLPCLAGLR